MQMFYSIWISSWILELCTENDPAYLPDGMAHKDGFVVCLFYDEEKDGWYNWKNQITEQEYTDALDKSNECAIKCKVGKKKGAKPMTRVRKCDCAKKRPAA